jgi:hypothetical protein
MAYTIPNIGSSLQGVVDLTDPNLHRPYIDGVVVSVTAAQLNKVGNGLKTVTAHTAAADVLTEAMSGSVHTNLGDTNGAGVKLPADAAAGTTFHFSIQVAQAFDVIIGKSAGKFYLNGTISTDDTGADMKVTADDEGEALTLCCDGANGWFPLSMNGTWTVSQP